MDGIAYVEAVDKWVLQGIQCGLNTISDLTADLPGVYPTCIRESIHRLSKSGAISSKTMNDLLATALSSGEAFSAKENDGLPLPHPLDFEWRFTAETSLFILEKAQSLVKPPDDILLLSTPSVFQHAKRKNVANIRYVGDATVVTETLCGNADSFSQCDCFSSDYNIAPAGAVVIDPPWYEEYTHAFIRLAAASCKREGYIIISCPPEGTRPGIKSEWDRLLACAEELGLALVTEDETLLFYDSPFFEVNALKADGIWIGRSWRKGVLRIFKKVNRVKIERPSFDQSTNWKEFHLGETRFKVNGLSSTVKMDPRLYSVIPGDILPTVSRRDPRRSLGNVWTSGNRIFQCHRPDVLSCVFSAVKSCVSPVEAVRSIYGNRKVRDNESVIDECVSQINSIIRKESVELNTLLYKL